MLLLFSVLLLVYKHKKKKLLCGVAVEDDVKRLEIYCKVMSFKSSLLWPPYIIGQAIYIFILWFLLLSSSSFFPRLHMVWP